MIAFLALTVLVQSVFGGNLVEVLQNDGETTLIALVKQAGLADALLSGKYSFLWQVKIYCTVKSSLKTDVFCIL